MALKLRMMSGCIARWLRMQEIHRSLHVELSHVFTAHVPV